MIPVPPLTKRANTEDLSGGRAQPILIPRLNLASTIPAPSDEQRRRNASGTSPETSTLVVVGGTKPFVLTPQPPAVHGAGSGPRNPNGRDVDVFQRRIIGAEPWVDDARMLQSSAIPVVLSEPAQKEWFWQVLGNEAPFRTAIIAEERIEFRDMVLLAAGERVVAAERERLRPFFDEFLQLSLLDHENVLFEEALTRDHGILDPFRAGLLRLQCQENLDLVAQHELRMRSFLKFYETLDREQLELESDYFSSLSEKVLEAEQQERQLLTTVAGVAGVKRTIEKEINRGQIKPFIASIFTLPLKLQCFVVLPHFEAEVRREVEAEEHQHREWFEDDFEDGLEAIFGTAGLGEMAEQVSNRDGLDDESRRMSELDSFRRSQAGRNGSTTSSSSSGASGRSRRSQGEDAIAPGAISTYQSAHSFTDTGDTEGLRILSTPRSTLDAAWFADHGRRRSTISHRRRSSTWSNGGGPKSATIPREGQDGAFWDRKSSEVSELAKSGGRGGLDQKLSPLSRQARGSGIGSSLGEGDGSEQSDQNTSTRIYTFQVALQAEFARKQNGLLCEWETLRREGIENLVSEVFKGVLLSYKKGRVLLRDAAQLTPEGRARLRIEEEEERERLRRLSEERTVLESWIAKLAPLIKDLMCQNLSTKREEICRRQLLEVEQREDFARLQIVEEQFEAHRVWSYFWKLHLEENKLWNVRRSSQTLAHPTIAAPTLTLPSTSVIDTQNLKFLIDLTQNLHVPWRELYIVYCM
jgi:hypothetical protein